MTEAPLLRGAVGVRKIDAKLDRVMQDARRMLAAHCLSDVGERSWARLIAPASTPTLVVIGEIKRGKSSLVNALLGNREVSPVDVEIATSAFIRFVPQQDPATAGETTLLFAGDRRRRIDLQDLPEWVTVAGSHVLDARIDELPIGAEVVMASPFLPNAAIVDTPGVGGLNPNHLRLATDAATRASILLMTCDASAPITAPELAFLESVSAEVDSVVMAVTKIDTNLRYWRSIVDENRRLLRAHAPRFADIPIVGVSSRRAAAALEMEAGERRDAALRSSGLPELAEHLGRITESGDRLAVVNALRIARSGLERVSNQLAAQRSAIQGGTVVVQELTAEKERLQALQDEQQSGWRDYLIRDLNSTQHQSTRLLDQKLDVLKAQWRQKLETAKLDVLRRSPQLFIADMTADLEVLVAEISDHYVGAVAQMVADLSAEIEVSVDKLGSLRIPDENTRRPGVLDPQILTIGVMGSNTLGLGAVKALGGLGLAAGATVVWPVCLALGGAWIAVNLGYRAVKMGRQNLLQWLNTTVAAVRKDVVSDLQERTNVIRPVILDGYRQYLAQSIAQVRELIAKANTAAKASRDERADAIREIDGKRKDLSTAMAAVDAQLSFFTKAASLAGVPVHQEATALTSHR